MGMPSESDKLRRDSRIREAAAGRRRPGNGNSGGREFPLPELAGARRRSIIAHRSVNPGCSTSAHPPGGLQFLKIYGLPPAGQFLTAPSHDLQFLNIRRARAFNSRPRDRVRPFPTAPAFDSPARQFLTPSRSRIPSPSTLPRASSSDHPEKFDAPDDS